MALYDTNKNLIAGSRKTNIYRCDSFDEYEALPAAEKAKYDYVATPETEFTKYFVISNSDVNVGESFYTDVTNSFEVFKIVADTIFNDIDASGKLIPYVGHATAYTTDNSGYPNMGVTTWVASACMGANGHPYIRMRIFLDGGGEYRFGRSQDGAYTLSCIPDIRGEIFTANTTRVIHSASNNAIEILGMSNSDTNLLDTVIVTGFTGQTHHFDKGNVNPTITSVYDSATNTYDISITTTDTFIVSITSCRGVTIS